MMVVNDIVHAWINQPSTAQPLHKYHGKRGILVLSDNDNRMYFTDGDIRSMSVLLEHVSIIQD